MGEQSSRRQVSVLYITTLSACGSSLGPMSAHMSSDSQERERVNVFFVHHNLPVRQRSFYPCLESVSASLEEIARLYANLKEMELVAIGGHVESAADFPSIGYGQYRAVQPIATSRECNTSHLPAPISTLGTQAMPMLLLRIRLDAASIG